MLKKVITTAILGVSALGVMAANATTPGIYVSGQLGYANTHMGSKINITDISNKLDSAIVLNNGANNISNNGLAGRLAIGYQFNQNFALEMGYMQLAQKKIGFTIKNEGAGEVNSMQLNQNAIDFAVKGILPVASNFNAYAKLGAAYLTTNLSLQATELNDPTMTMDISNIAGFSKRTWAPEAAIGVSYDITPNVSADTSWTHIQPVGKNRPGNIDFVAVGLGYHFG